MNDKTIKPTTREEASAVREELRKARPAQVSKLKQSYRIHLPVRTSRKMRRQAESVLETAEFREFQQKLPALPQDPGPKASDVKKREYELLRLTREEERKKAITAFVARKVGLER